MAWQSGGRREWDRVVQSLRAVSGRCRMGEVGESSFSPTVKEEKENWRREEASWFVALPREHVPSNATDVLGRAEWTPEPPGDGIPGQNLSGTRRAPVAQEGQVAFCGLCQVRSTASAP